MISDTMQQTINDQINAEIHSGYLYLSMAAWLESQDLSGMANWMEVQAQEEMSHAMKFYKFLIERGGTVELQPIEGPKTEWESPLEAFEDALKHEEYITGRINKMMDQAVEEKDYASRSLLQWFIDEQVEEEDNAGQNVNKTRMIQDHPGGLYMLDKELGARTFTPPAAGEEGN